MNNMHMWPVALRVVGLRPHAWLSRRREGTIAGLVNTHHPSPPHGNGGPNMTGSHSEYRTPFQVYIMQLDCAIKMQIIVHTFHTQY